MSVDVTPATFNSDGVVDDVVFAGFDSPLLPSPLDKTLAMARNVDLTTTASTSLNLGLEHEHAKCLLDDMRQERGEVSRMIDIIRERKLEVIRLIHVCHVQRDAIFKDLAEFKESLMEELEQVVKNASHGTVMTHRHEEQQASGLQPIAGHSDTEDSADASKCRRQTVAGPGESPAIMPRAAVRQAVSMAAPQVVLPGVADRATQPCQLRATLGAGVQGPTLSMGSSAVAPLEARERSCLAPVQVSPTTSMRPSCRLVTNASAAAASLCQPSPQRYAPISASRSPPMRPRDVFRGSSAQVPTVRHAAIRLRTTSPPAQKSCGPSMPPFSPQTPMAPMAVLMADGEKAAVRLRTSSPSAQNSYAQSMPPFAPHTPIAQAAVDGEKAAVRLRTSSPTAQNSYAQSMPPFSPHTPIAQAAVDGEKALRVSTSVVNVHPRQLTPIRMQSLPILEEQGGAEGSGAAIREVASAMRRYQQHCSPQPGSQVQVTSVPAVYPAVGQLAPCREIVGAGMAGALQGIATAPVQPVQPIHPRSPSNSHTFEGPARMASGSMTVHRDMAESDAFATKAKALTTLAGRHSSPSFKKV